ncbi:hypothetical protein Tco_0612577 [Tanacetum coccineum]
MDDPNITMEEYIRLEEEKARRRGQVYNWETATYDKIWCNEDVHDLRSIETEFSAIVINDVLTSKVALSCEPTVSPINDNQIDFRISFDEFDDEDYTYIRLEEEKARRRGQVYNWETATYGKIWCNEDVHDLRSIETEFPAIVLNDTLTSEVALSCEPTYTDVDIVDFKERLGRIYGREIHRVQLFDFGGLTDLMVEGLSGRILMEHRDARG